MRNRGRIALLTISHLAIGIVAAGGTAWCFQDAFTRANAMANHMILISRYAAYVEVQRSMAGPGEYRDALLTFQTFLAAVDQIHTPNDLPYNEHT